MAFNWFRSKVPDPDKRMISMSLDIDFIKNTLKDLQNQINSLDIRMLEVKKDYHKKLKAQVEAIKEEEEVEQEEGEKYI